MPSQPSLFPMPKMATRLLVAGGPIVESETFRLGPDGFIQAPVAERQWQLEMRAIRALGALMQAALPPGHPLDVQQGLVVGQGRPRAAVRLGLAGDDAESELAKAWVAVEGEGIALLIPAWPGRQVLPPDAARSERLREAAGKAPLHINDADFPQVAVCGIDGQEPVVIAGALALPAPIVTTRLEEIQARATGYCVQARVLHLLPEGQGGRGRFDAHFDVQKFYSRVREVSELDAPLLQVSLRRQCANETTVSTLLDFKVLSWDLIGGPVVERPIL